MQPFATVVLPNGGEDAMTTFKFSSHSLITTLIVLYIILTTVQLYAFLHQKFRNVLVYIFTLSLTLHCLSFFFVGVDKVLINAQDGVDILITIADVIKILSMVSHFERRHLRKTLM